MSRMIRAFKYAFIIVLITGLLSGCSSVLSEYFTVASSVGPSDYSALNYYRWLESADAVVLEFEMARIQQNPSDSYSMIDTVQLAMISSFSVVENDADRNTAIELLKNLKAPSLPTDRQLDYFSFSEVLISLLEQRQVITVLEASQTMLEQELQTANESNHDLQEQIEALTNIEQQLIEREQLQENNE